MRRHGWCSVEERLGPSIALLFINRHGPIVGWSDAADWWMSLCEEPKVIRRYFSMLQRRSFEDSKVTFLQRHGRYLMCIFRFRYTVHRQFSMFHVSNKSKFTICCSYFHSFLLFPWLYLNLIGRWKFLRLYRTRAEYPFL